MNPSKPTAWRASGSSWRKFSFPGHSGEQVLAAEATSASDVWVVTTNFSRARVLRWNGSKWSVKGSFSRVLYDVTVLGSNDVWVFGQTPPGGAWHYNGHSWKHVTSDNGLQGGSALNAHSI